MIALALWYLAHLPVAAYRANCYRTFGPVAAVADTATDEQWAADPAGCRQAMKAKSFGFRYGGRMPRSVAEHSRMYQQVDYAGMELRLLAQLHEQYPEIAKYRRDFLQPATPETVKRLGLDTETLGQWEDSLGLGTCVEDGRQTAARGTTWLDPAAPVEIPAGTARGMRPRPNDDGQCTGTLRCRNSGGPRTPGFHCGLCGGRFA